MDFLYREELELNPLHGRIIQKAIGKDSHINSHNMTMGFAHYSIESGKMEPHAHAEEICYILEAKKSWVRFGRGKNDLPVKMNLEAGMILHIPEKEFHVFEFEEDGYVDLIFFYGRVEGIRPEE